MPKLWSDTIEAHRNAIAEAIMQKTAEIAVSEGVHTLTMARIAEETGIGRATLYKYFGNVTEILSAWHEQQVASRLHALVGIKDTASTPIGALEAVLLAYAENARHDHGHALAAQLHAMPHVEAAHKELETFVRDMIAAAVKAGEIEGGASFDELTRFALAALAAGDRSSRPAIKRLVAMILRGLGA